MFNMSFTGKLTEKWGFNYFFVFSLFILKHIQINTTKGIIVYGDIASCIHKDYINIISAFHSCHVI